MRLKALHIDKKELMLHVLFWVSWIVSFTFIQSIGETWKTSFIWLMYYIITLPVFAIHTYLIAYWLLPKVFFNSQYFLFALGLIVFLLLFSVVELLVSNYLVYIPFDASMALKPGFLNIKNIIISGVGNHFIILVFLAIKVGKSWYLAKNQHEELLQNKEETELEIYQYQMQPKMVFTLLDELEQVAKADEKKTPAVLIKISNFLNRFLYEGREERIPLNLEVKLIEEFLDIHKQALGSRLQSNLVVSGNLKAFVVPPLLLLPFINNALKIAYGCNETFESTVVIKSEKKYLLFSFLFWSENEFRLNDLLDSEITKKRLNNNYPGKHRIIENTDTNFSEFSIELFY